jgi:hypothetical protein
MLPFRQRAKVMHQGAETGEVDVSVWPLGEPRESTGGQTWDWEGEAEIEAAELLVRKQNRRLALVDPEPTDPPVLTVIAAIRHDFLPHVELRLREVTG